MWHGSMFLLLMPTVYQASDSCCLRFSHATRRFTFCYVKPDVLIAAIPGIATN